MERKQPCPYSGCRFNCKSKTAHNAFYAILNAPKRKHIDDVISPHIDYEKLNQLGIQINNNHLTEKYILEHRC